MKTPANISRLIAIKILGQPLSETEQQQLDAWLKASKANVALFNQIKSLQATSQILELEQEAYGQKMAERFRRKITPPMRNPTNGNIFTHG